MPVPKITQVTPDKAPIGTEVLLQGEHLKAVKKVTFSGVEAIFRIESDSRVRATVPSVDNLENINVKVQDATGKGSGKGKFQLIFQEARALDLPPESVDTTIARTERSSNVIQQSDTSFRDLERCRAEAAWQNIQEVDARDVEYGSLAREMPTLIQTNGLAQSLAFLKAKNKAHHQKMFKHLSDWVCQRLNFQQGDLLENSLRINSQTYRRATMESLSFLQWIKRFTEAKIEKIEETLR